MKITLSDGTVIEGTFDELSKFVGNHRPPVINYDPYLPPARTDPIPPVTYLVWPPAVERPFRTNWDGSPAVTC